MKTSYYLDLEPLPEYFRRFHLACWREAGAERMILPYALLEHGARDEKFFAALLDAMGEARLCFHDAHVPWSGDWALNTPEPEARKRMLSNIRRALAMCAEAGAKTLTAHIGDNVFRPGNGAPPPAGDERRRLLYEALEKLIPEAEKQRVVLCIENIFSPADTVEELLGCFARFSSPYFGCCYDAGHANIMTPAPGKRPEMAADYVRELWRSEPWRYGPAEIPEELLEHIVSCHLHDNDGFGDEHRLPGEGTVDWKSVIGKLRRCRRLLSIQSEVAYVYYACPPGKLVRTFQKIEKRFENQ